MNDPWSRIRDAASPSDEDLILAVQAGDRQAFDQLVARFKVRLYNFVLRMVNDPDLAEEITQDAFVRAYLNADKYRTIARFSTWLYTIAINLVRNHARKKKRSPIYRLPLVGKEDGDKVELEAPDEAAWPDEDLEKKELRQQIAEIMVKIPAHYREPFVLREVHDMSYEEIAAATGLKLGTVRSRINRARAHFKRLWTARFKDVDLTSDGGSLR